MDKKVKSLEVISAAELSSIKKRLEEASTKPWIWFEEERDPPYDPKISIIEVLESGQIRRLKPMFTLNADEDKSRENAELICKARDDIRKLIRAIEHLRKECCNGCLRDPKNQGPI